MLSHKLNYFQQSILKFRRFSTRNIQLNRNKPAITLTAQQTPKIINNNSVENNSPYEKYQDSIFYSSCKEIESKLVLSSQKKNKFGKFINDKVNKTKPFSMASKYLLNEQNDDDNDKKFDINQIKSIDFDQLKEDLQLMKQSVNSQRKQNQRTSFSDWMQEYESYKSDEEGNFGTPDPNVPVSKVPCYGCGSNLHCADPSLPGYLPSEIFRGQKEDYLMTILCQRCHFLKTYNTAIDLTVSPDEYIKMISSIQDKFALAILMVDLTDFPCSIWPNITEILGNKRPIFIVGNKVDLLPRDSEQYLNHIRYCLEENIEKMGISKINIKHTCLISAQTGYGIEELITKLHNIWAYKGDVYLVGCTNVGKSSLFNALLRSDYCKVQASNIIKRATTSPWPGTTLRMLKFPILRPNDWRLYLRTQRLQSDRVKQLAEERLRRDQARETGKIKYATLIGHIGKTFENIQQQNKPEIADSFALGKGSQSSDILKINEKSKEYITSKWFYDTPGVVHSEQILNLLTVPELLLTLPKLMLTPRSFLIKANMSLFLAGLGRMDCLSNDTIHNAESSIRFTVYASHELPILIVDTNKATEIYENLLGTNYLAVPFGDQERLNEWPMLKSIDTTITCTGKGNYKATCDILLSSAGWVAIHLPENQTAEFKVWTPEARGICVRDPALIQYGIQLKGPRIRGSLAYAMKAKFFKFKN